MADVYLACMNRTRLTQAQIAKFSGVAPSVLALIAKGRTKRPKPRTIDRISHAFGRHPRLTHVYDKEEERRARRELYHAAGYDDPYAPGAYVSLLQTALEAELGSPERAAALASRIREWRELDVDEIRRLGVVPSAPAPSDRQDRPRR